MEGILLGCLVLFNAWLVSREAMLTQKEMSSRIQHTIDAIRKHGISDKDDLRFPTTIPTIAVTRVVRDGIVRLMPCNLLVEDDVVLLAYGETSPARVR